MTEVDLNFGELRRWQTEADEDLESLKINFERVFEELKARGVNYVSVSFNGGHDEGFTEDPVFLEALESEGFALNLESSEYRVPWRITACNDATGSFGPVVEDWALVDAVASLADKALIGFLGDCWYDGTPDSDGDIIFDVNNKRIRCEYGEMERVDQPALHLSITAIPDEPEDNEGDDDDDE